MSTGAPMSLEDYYARYSHVPREDFEVLPRTDPAAQDTTEQEGASAEQVARIDHDLLEQCKDAIRIRLSGNRRNHGSTRQGLWKYVHTKVRGFDHTVLLAHFNRAYDDLAATTGIDVIRGASEDGSQDFIRMQEDEALRFERGRNRQDHGGRRGGKSGAVRRGAGRKVKHYPRSAA